MPATPSAVTTRNPFVCVAATSGITGLALLAGGMLSWTEAWHLVRHTLPVLAFLVSISLVGDLCEEAGLFRASVALAARASRGRTWVLVTLFALVGTVATWTLSLDATAVLLAPLAIGLARTLKLPVAPFAFLTLWLANGTSLLLPAANLTNLLAVVDIRLPARSYVALALLPQLAVCAWIMAWFALRFGRRLPWRFDATVEMPAQLFGAKVAGGVAVGIGVGILVGVPAWVAASIGLFALVVLHRFRGNADAVTARSLLRNAPWDMAAFASGLFLVMAALEPILGRFLSVSPGTDASSLLRIALTGAVGANIGNNLPAYLTLAPLVQDGPVRLMALLIGVNTGPGVALWGSLASLLWWQRCRRRGQYFSLARIAAEGLPIALGSVALGTLALAFVA